MARHIVGDLFSHGVEQPAVATVSFLGDQSLLALAAVGMQCETQKILLIRHFTVGTYYNGLPTLRGKVQIQILHRGMYF